MVRQSKVGVRCCGRARHGLPGALGMLRLGSEDVSAPTSKGAHLLLLPTARSKRLVILISGMRCGHRALAAYSVWRRDTTGGY